MKDIIFNDELHKWDKTNLVTKKDVNGIYDEYKCSVCGIVGRRYGLSRDLSIIKKYENSLFVDNCKSALFLILEQNKDVLKIKTIERKLKCPDTIQKWLQGKQGLPEKWEQPLRAFLKSFAQSILDCV